MGLVVSEVAVLLVLQPGGMEGCHGLVETVSSPVWESPEGQRGL